jgi:DNA-binding transcriptional ArsR family regulator
VRPCGLKPCGAAVVNDWRVAIHSTIWLTNLRGRLILNHMVELLPERLDAVFHALADPTRRAMLHRLADAPQSVGELAAPHRMSLAAASKHIKSLERAGLVRRRVQGRTHVCRLEPMPLAGAHDWLGFYQRFWTAQFDALDAVLEAENAAKSQAAHSETTKTEGDPP